MKKQTALNNGEASKKTNKDSLAQKLNHLIGEILNGEHLEHMKILSDTILFEEDQDLNAKKEALSYIKSAIGDCKKKSIIYPILREKLRILVGTPHQITSDLPFIDGTGALLDLESRWAVEDILAAFYNFNPAVDFCYISQDERQ